MARRVPNRQIAQEAADWAVHIDAGPLNAAARSSLADWLRGSPAHVDELLYAASLLGGLGEIDPERLLEADADGASAAEVVPFLREPHRPAQGTIDRFVPARTPGSRRLLATAAALLLAAVTGLVVAAAWPDRSQSIPETLTYTTGHGEQRSITLADGSVVYLNTGSQVTVRYSAVERRLDLGKGEALFEVAHDEARPFRVYAAETMTQAVGTRFNVRHTTSGVRVVVVEGKVLVDSRIGMGPRPQRAAAGESGEPDLAPDQALLTAGQQAQLGASVGVPVVAAANVVNAASWRIRQLSFDDASLAEIVEEFNRYNRTPIVLGDASLGRTRLSGVFDANDPGSFIAFLELSTSIEVDRSRPSRIVLKPR